jgi:3-isopropylmalate dehydrogenase
MSRTLHIVTLPGDGIGPEVTSAAIRVAEWAAERIGLTLEWEPHPFGGAAIDATGMPFPESTRQACKLADAVLLGAIGGPAWNDVAPERRPEQGLLALRRTLGAFANLRPAQVPEALAGLSVLPPDRVAGTDLLVVRELTGGIYFGEPRRYSEAEAQDTMRYSAGEIDRIARVAFEQARLRRGKVTSVDKANVLATSRLWRERVTRLHSDYPDVELDHMYVDNAAMQVVRDPRAFDVILTANLFGDILSDLASTLAGSLGVLPSASVGGSTSLFEPVHGSAPDIAGRNEANPVAAMLSSAMLFEGTGQQEVARRIRHAVAATLKAGVMTADLSSDSVSTTTFTDRVCEEIDRISDMSITT